MFDNFLFMVDNLEHCALTSILLKLALFFCSHLFLSLVKGSNVTTFKTCSSGLLSSPERVSHVVALDPFMSDKCNDERDGRANFN